MKPEQSARARIDSALGEAGWQVQDFAASTRRDGLRSVARLCAMNLMLHGVGPNNGATELPIRSGVDSLRAEPSEHFDVVLTNPRFGRKSSVVSVNEEGEEHREQQTYDGRWRAYACDELAARDKCSLDLFWLRDESLEDAANLPEPHVLAQEIADDLRAALAQIEEILEDLPKGTSERS